MADQITDEKIYDMEQKLEKESGDSLPRVCDVDGSGTARAGCGSGQFDCERNRRVEA